MSPFWSQSFWAFWPDVYLVAQTWEMRGTAEIAKTSSHTFLTARARFASFALLVRDSSRGGWWKLDKL